MEPKWIQDSDSKSIQPKGFPQFEIAGAQLDGNYRKKASQLLLKVVGGSVIVIWLVFVVWAIPQARNFHKSSFGRMQVDTTQSDVRKFDGVEIRIKKWDRVTEIPGFLFTSKVKAGFQYIVVDLVVRNGGTEPFIVNTFSFSVTTDKDVRYRADLETQGHPEKLKYQTLKTGEEATGILVFKVPNAASIATLELLGPEGIIDQVKI